MHCTHCGEQNSDKDRFCVKCGFGIIPTRQPPPVEVVSPAAPPPISQPAVVVNSPAATEGLVQPYCGGCGARLSGPARFCSQCGAGVVTVAVVPPPVLPPMAETPAPAIEIPGKMWLRLGAYFVDGSLASVAAIRDLVRTDNGRILAGRGIRGSRPAAEQSAVYGHPARIYGFRPDLLSHNHREVCLRARNRIRQKRRPASRIRRNSAARDDRQVLFGDRLRHRLLASDSRSPKANVARPNGRHGSAKRCDQSCLAQATGRIGGDGGRRLSWNWRLRRLDSQCATSATGSRIGGRGI